MAFDAEIRRQRSEIRGQKTEITRLRQDYGAARRSEVRGQRSPAFAKASAFVITSARQVGAARRAEVRRQRSDERDQRAGVSVQVSGSKREKADTSDLIG